MVEIEIHVGGNKIHVVNVLVGILVMISCKYMLVEKEIQFGANRNTRCKCIGGHTRNEKMQIHIGGNRNTYM